MITYNFMISGERTFIKTVIGVIKFKLTVLINYGGSKLRGSKTYCLNYDATNDDDVRPKNRPPNKFKLPFFFLSSYFVS